MATVNFIGYKRQNASTLRGVMFYLMQDAKVKIGRDKLDSYHTEPYILPQVSHDAVRLISGKDCCGESALAEFMATKAVCGKSDGVIFYHYTQSFRDGEKISPATAHEMALQFAADNYPGFEVLITTHTDNDHLHSHFLINSVSFETGKKLHQPPDTLRKLRAYSDKQCQAYGLSTLEPYTFGRSRTPSRAERRATEKGTSWKAQLAKFINYCMEHSHSKNEFISNMDSLGYSVKWTDGRKNITYGCPNGKSCRDDRLNDSRYSKVNMELEFAIRQGEQAPQTDTLTGWERSRRKLYEPQQAEQSRKENQNYTPSTKGLATEILRCAKAIERCTYDDELQTLAALVLLTGLSFVGIYALIESVKAIPTDEITDDTVSEMIDTLKQEPENVDGYEEQEQSQGFTMSM